MTEGPFERYVASIREAHRLWEMHAATAASFRRHLVALGVGGGFRPDGDEFLWEWNRLCVVRGWHVWLRVRPGWHAGEPYTLRWRTSVSGDAPPGCSDESGALSAYEMDAAAPGDVGARLAAMLRFVALGEGAAPPAACST